VKSATVTKVAITTMKAVIAPAWGSGAERRDQQAQATSTKVVATPIAIALMTRSWSRRATDKGEKLGEDRSPATGP
jgi:hypothetical protein